MNNDLLRPFDQEAAGRGKPMIMQCWRAKAGDTGWQTSYAVDELQEEWEELK